jgi:hypothetical protein
VEISEQAVEAAKLKRPNIVLMDINMMPISGFRGYRKDQESITGFKNYWCFHAFATCICQENASNRRTGLCNQKFFQGRNDEGDS